MEASNSKPDGVHNGVAWLGGVKWHPHNGRPMYWDPDLAGWKKPNGKHPAPDFSAQMHREQNGRFLGGVDEGGRVVFKFDGRKLVSNMDAP